MRNILEKVRKCDHHAVKGMPKPLKFLIALGKHPCAALQEEKRLVCAKIVRRPRKEITVQPSG